MSRAARGCSGRLDDWLTPRRLRALTIGAICAAALVSTISLSGSTPARVHAAPSGGAAHTVDRSQIGQLTR